MKNRNTLFTTILLVLACFVILHLAQGTPPPKLEDRGNGNSAAENVQALNIRTTGSDNTAHGWFSLFSNTSGVQKAANGFDAPYQDTTAGAKTAMVYKAFFRNTTAAANIANRFKSPL